jgi:hypothetical protein
MLTVVERVHTGRPPLRYPDAAEVARRWPRLTRRKPTPVVPTPTTPTDRRTTP